MARTAVFALISLLLALGAHRFAGGARPGVLTALAAGGALGAVGWLASRRERSGYQLGVLVVVSQALVHVWFVLPAVLGAVRSFGGAGGSTSALTALLFCHHGSTPVSAATLQAATQGLHLHVPSAAAPVATGTLARQMVLMLGAHLLAAIVVACWLRVGESAAWEALRRAVQTLCTGPWTPRRPSTRPAALLVDLLLTGRRWAGPLSGRGPPAGRPPLLAA